MRCYLASTWEKKCRGKGEEVEERCPNLRMVWVSCEGDTSADKEYMGYLHYTQYPGIQHSTNWTIILAMAHIAFSAGFQGYYFPYLNQQNYLRYRFC